MENKIHITMFSQVEDKAYGQFQKVRDVFFEPLCVLLTKIGIKPNYLSYFNAALAIPFVFFLTASPIISFGVLMLSLLLDSVDGCLARHQKVMNESGALLDIGVDHFILFTVLLGLIYTKTIDGFWGAAYGINYLLLVVLVIAMRSLKVSVVPIVRSKYYLYLVWALFIFTGLNYFDLFLVFFAIYMFLTNLFLFHNLRCSLP
jgi:phosphatidylglycerophosphate synthase